MADQQVQRIIRGDDVEVRLREGYHYQRYVTHDASSPYNFLFIFVSNRHKLRRVVHGIRNYFVVSGSGTFSIEGDRYSVRSGDLITICPGEQYAYAAHLVSTMRLIEFNIPTDGKIEHEDLE